MNPITAEVILITINISCRHLASHLLELLCLHNAGMSSTSQRNLFLWPSYQLKHSSMYSMRSICSSNAECKRKTAVTRILAKFIICFTFHKIVFSLTCDKNPTYKSALLVNKYIQRSWSISSEQAQIILNEVVNENTAHSPKSERCSINNNVKLT